MLTKLLTDPLSSSRKRLILIFLGWGFDVGSFKHLHKRGHDILLIRGYDGVDAAAIEQTIKSLPCFNRYEEVILIAWSFGVKIAQIFLSQTSLSIGMRIAVNGTENHVDDNEGIPSAIFDGTLANLNERNLQKFRLRCAGGDRSLLMDYEEDNLEALKAELQFFEALRNITPTPQHWDHAIVGERDLIFTPQNQRHYWEGRTSLTATQAPHIPDFQWILDRFIIDKDKVKDQFGKSSDTYHLQASVQRKIAHRLLAKCLPLLDMEQPHILEVGCGDGYLFDRLHDNKPDGRYILNDLTISSQLASRCEGIQGVRAVEADCESKVFTDRHLQTDCYDLVISSSTIQWLNSPARFVQVAFDALKPGGILAISFYNKGTLTEVSSITGSSLQYPDPGAILRSLDGMQRNVLVEESNTEILRFETATHALAHLRQTGVNALPTGASRGAVRRLITQWPKDSEGKVTLTYNCHLLILQKQ